MNEIEISSLDGRYEGHRLKDRTAEARLLAAIAERGIAEPLEGVEEGERHVLLNGFKPWRCERKLGLASVPYLSLGYVHVLRSLSHAQALSAGQRGA